MKWSRSFIPETMSLKKALLLLTTTSSELLETRKRFTLPYLTSIVILSFGLQPSRRRVLQPSSRTVWYDQCSWARRHKVNMNQVKEIHPNKVAGENFAGSNILNNTIEATASYATQKSPTATELRMISQPSGDVNLNRYQNYVYQSGAGQGAFIYHAEQGINAYHSEFYGRQGEWVFTPRAISLSKNTMDAPRSSDGEHSTCTASKASGKLYGAAKYATLVVVKMPDLTEASMLEILWTIYDHIRHHHRKGKSVASISWGSLSIYKRFQSDAWADQILEIATKIMVLGVVVVSAAGNSAGPDGL